MALRILHLLASPVWSGPAEIVAGLAAAQRQLGHEVSVAVDRKRGRPPAEEHIVPRLEALGLLDDGGLELSVKSSPAAVLADIRRLRQRRVDVVHAHFSHDHLLARFGRPRGATLIRSLHAPRSLRWSLPAADGYSAPSRAMLTRLGARRGMYLPPLVGPEFTRTASPAELRNRLGLYGAPLVGMVSTFQPSRRHDLALDAFAALRQRAPAARLVLVGDGMLEPNLREEVRRRGLVDSVVFAGYQSGAAFIDHMGAFDVVWILGLGNDWSGRAAAQARACGVRVVAVDEGGLAEWADSIVPTDPGAIVEATLTGDRRERKVPSPEEIAREVLAFYAACGGRP